MSMNNGTELTLDDALEEFSSVRQWLEKFQQMQQQSTQVLMRASFLEGFIAGNTPKPEELDVPLDEITPVDLDEAS